MIPQTITINQAEFNQITSAVNRVIQPDDHLTIEVFKNKILVHTIHEQDDPVLRSYLKRRV